LRKYDSLAPGLIAIVRIVSRPPDKPDKQFRGVSVMRTGTVRKGLFRTNLPGLGECARVDMSAGDAAPFLEREMYVLLGFQPVFEDLPMQDVAANTAATPHWPRWN
jgi:hypothetical protein